MAYSDYGAFVYLNGKRRFDKEDATAFLEFDCEIDDKWVSTCHHGIMGDGNIQVICHKQGLPEIYEATEKGIEKVNFCNENTDYYDYGMICFDYKGYHFIFESGKPYYAEMTEPNEDKWVCKYDYLYGAGF